MPAIVKSRPSCRRCGGVVRGLRCSQCGRLALLEVLLHRTWGQRY